MSDLDFVAKAKQLQVVAQCMELLAPLPLSERRGVVLTLMVACLGDTSKIDSVLDELMERMNKGVKP